MKINLNLSVLKVCSILTVFLTLNACAGSNWQQNLKMPDFLSPSRPTSVTPQATKPVSAPVKVALLVPLTGKYSEVGKQLLDSAQLALFQFNNPNIELLPIDTKETAQSAVSAAKKAVSENVTLILGPLFSDATREIMPIAQQAGIQVVSFSNDKSLAGTGAFVIGLRPEQQISRVVQYANLHYGIDQIAVLLPEGQGGEVMQKAMNEVLLEYNQRVKLTATEWYSSGPEVLDNIGDKARLTYNAIQANDIPRRPYQKKGAIFIAEGGDNAKKIANVLNNEGMDKNQIQLLGSALWYDAQLLASGELEGAIFAGFSPDKQQYFEQNLFMTTYNYRPKAIASLAYDGVALAATLYSLENGQITRDMLTNTRGFMGVNGVFRLNNNGLIERGLAVIQIQNRKFVVIDPAPKVFKK